MNKKHIQHNKINKIQNRCSKKILSCIIKNQYVNINAECKYFHGSYVINFLIDSNIGVSEGRSYYYGFIHSIIDHMLFMFGENLDTENIGDFKEKLLIIINISSVHITLELVTKYFHDESIEWNKKFKEALNNGNEDIEKMLNLLLNIFHYIFNYNWNYKKSEILEDFTTCLLDSKSIPIVENIASGSLIDDYTPIKELDMSRRNVLNTLKKDTLGLKLRNDFLKIHHKKVENIVNQIKLIVNDIEKNPQSIMMSGMVIKDFNIPSVAPSLLDMILNDMKNEFGFEFITDLARNSIYVKLLK
jgi:hypothetical protein